MTREERKAEKMHFVWVDDAGDVISIIGNDPYGVGINCDGRIIVKPLRDWYTLANTAALTVALTAARETMFDRIRAKAQSRVEYWKRIAPYNFDGSHMDMLIGQFQAIADDIAAALTGKTA